MTVCPWSSSPNASTPGWTRTHPGRPSRSSSPTHGTTSTAPREHQGQQHAKRLPGTARAHQSLTFLRHANVPGGFTHRQSPTALPGSMAIRTAAEPRYVENSRPTTSMILFHHAATAREVLDPCRPTALSRSTSLRFRARPIRRIPSPCSIACTARRSRIAVARH